MATALVISTDGSIRSVDIDPDDSHAIATAVEGTPLDVVALGTIDVFVDDNGHWRGRQLNPVASELVARFGHPWPIHGPALLLGYNSGETNIGLDEARLTELADYGITAGK